MKISLITPAPPGSRTGNRATAVRWARILEQLGHDVEIAVDYTDTDADLMVALHACRSAASIDQFHRRHPDRPLIVALSGTDVYRDLATHRDTVIASLDKADVLIGLHDLVADALPARYRETVAVIYQSAEAATGRAPPRPDRFDVLVVGHLRDEKDPLLTASAARLLAPASRIGVVHLGRAQTPGWAARAEAEMSANPRYDWRGEVDGAEVGAWLSRARLMVLSSVMEGGANVISEAIVAGTPVLASRIEGSVGLLGRDYPGYFATGDRVALRDLLARAEDEPDFLAELGRACEARARHFTPEREREAWRGVLDRVVAGRR